MNDRLHTVVAQVLGVAPEKLTDADSTDTLESWDSLAHVNLTLAVEAEFGVSLSPDEAAEMLSVGAIRRILKERDALCI